MKLYKSILRSVAFALFFAGCSRVFLNSGNFSSALSSEISSLGGRTNSILSDSVLLGHWRVVRDENGAAIDVQGLNADALTNLLTKAYGPPRLYSGATARHGVNLLYPVTNVQIALFVAAVPGGAEVTLTKRVSEMGNIDSAEKR
jgi:hypothetical protein